jgi:hypothetical protein
VLFNLFPIDLYIKGDGFAVGTPNPDLFPYPLLPSSFAGKRSFGAGADVYTGVDEDSYQPGLKLPGLLEGLDEIIAPGPLPRHRRHHLVA